MLRSDMIIVKVEVTMLLGRWANTLFIRVESSLQALILVGFSANIEVTMCHQLIHRAIMIDTVIMYYKHPF